MENIIITKSMKVSIKRLITKWKWQSEKIMGEDAEKARMIKVLKQSPFKNNKEALAYALKCIDDLFSKKKSKE